MQFQWHITVGNVLSLLTIVAYLIRSINKILTKLDEAVKVRELFEEKIEPLLGDIPQMKNNVRALQRERLSMRDEFNRRFDRIEKKLDEKA